MQMQKNTNIMSAIDKRVKGEYFYYPSCALLMVISLIYLLSGVFYFLKTRHEIALGWTQLFYIFMPSMLFFGSLFVLIFRKALFRVVLKYYIFVMIFLPVAVNLSVTAAAPWRLYPLYRTFGDWSGINLPVESGVLWVIALFIFAIYFVWNLGYGIMDAKYPTYYLIARSLFLVPIIFLGAPVLYKSRLIDIPPTFPKALFILLTAVYYILFLMVRIMAATAIGEGEEINWRHKVSIPRLGAVTLMMAVLYPPYFLAIYFVPGPFIWTFSNIVNAWAYMTENFWRLPMLVLVIVIFLNLRRIYWLYKFGGKYM